jgi:hypothetical protein
MSKLQISTKYQGGWVAELELVDLTEDFPTEVFLWSIEPDGSLGDFVAILRFMDIDKYPVYTPKSSNFGQRIARTNTGILKSNSKVELMSMIAVVKSAFSLLIEDYQIDGTTSVETFPA